jgi:hypothetical protein
MCLLNQKTLQIQQRKQKLQIQQKITLKHLNPRQNPTQINKNTKEDSNREALQKLPTTFAAARINSKRERTAQIGRGERAMRLFVNENGEIRKQKLKSHYVAIFRIAFDAVFKGRTIG